MNKRFTNLFLLLLISALLLPVACCEKETPPEPPVPEEDLSQLTLSGEQYTADNTSVWMLFKGGATTKSVEYAFVPFLETTEDGFVFDMDNCGSAKVFPISELPVQLKCSNLGTYMLYARPVSEHGRRGESIAIPVICGYGGIEILSIDCVYMEYRVRIFNQSKCDQVVTGAIFDEDRSPVIEEYRLMDEFKDGRPLCDGETGKLVLRKLKSHIGYVVGVAMLKEKKVQDWHSFEIETPPYDGRKESPMALSFKIDSVTESEYTFTMDWGENTEIVMGSVVSFEPGVEPTMEDINNFIETTYLQPYSGLGYLYLEEGSHTQRRIFNADGSYDFYFVLIPMNENGLAGLGVPVYQYLCTLNN